MFLTVYLGIKRVRRLFYILVASFLSQKKMSVETATMHRCRYVRHWGQKSLVEHTRV